MIFVTGVNGFVGKHLVRELKQRGLLVGGLGNQEPLAHEEIASDLDFYKQCDITKPDEVARLTLKNVSAVINLAGLANVGASFANPDLYMDVNVKVLSVLGDELFKQNPIARMIAVSTGALYDPRQTMPLVEKSLLAEKSSPYAESKRAMEKVAQNFTEEGKDCIVVRPFNHIGPGQGLGFLIPDMVEKIRNIDQENPAITAGNLKTIRDYTDVRDIVKAYADLATAPKLNHQLYNVCSGTGRSGEDILRSICADLNVDFENLRIDIDQSLIRPTDPEKIIGNSSLLQTETGWTPKVTLAKTIRDIIKNLS